MLQLRIILLFSPLFFSRSVFSQKNDLVILGTFNDADGMGKIAGIIAKNLLLKGINYYFFKK